MLALASKSGFRGDDMPLSEKEIIERLPDWIAEKKTSFLFGSGTSSPGMPLMSKFQDKEDGLIDINGLMYEIIKRNKFLIGAEMKEKLSEEESEAILGTLSTYKKFVEILLDMLGNVNSRERHKNINIFTTNYDLFIEKAVDDIVLSLAKRRKSDKKKAWIAISAVAVFLIAVIVVFAVTSNKNNSTPSATDDSVTAGTNTSATIGTDEAKGTHHAEINIRDYGVIKVELNGDVAPITVANFINLANSHFYNGLTFHRIIDGFMMQGGDPLGNGTGGSDNTIKGEFSQNGVENNLSHTRGAISMARSTDMDSASSQFFIVQSDSTYLDGQYACFGYVTDGMDIVDKICKNAVTTDSNGSVDAENQPVINSIKITD